MHGAATAAIRGGSFDIALGLLGHAILIAEQHSTNGLQAAAQMVKLVALLQAYQKAMGVPIESATSARDRELRIAGLVRRSSR